MDNDIGPDGGWSASARAWLDAIDRGDPSRALLLDPVMLRLCGDVGDARVLDLGCGEGRFGRMLAARGASTVGLDLVRELLTTAKARGSGDCVEGSAPALPFAAGSFDLVVSYITLVDIPDFRAAISESARVLRAGGSFVVANLGFVTATPDAAAFPQVTGWVRDEAGRRLYRPIDRYIEERSQVFDWAGIRIRNWHRPLSAYMQAYLHAGLRLLEFLEPWPSDGSLRDDPRLEDWYRVPEFTVMKWEKVG